MKTSESLYIKILLWAYERHEGFREQELVDEFKLNEGDWKMRWFLSVFKNGTNDNTPILIHMYNKRDGENEIGYWGLSEKGISAAIDYLELKEAREGGRKAMRVATISLIVAIVVGVIQILSDFEVI